MKQHIFSKSGLLLVFMAVLMSFFACRKDQFLESNNLPSTNEGMPTNQDARQYFDNQVAELRKVNIESSKTDAHFTALDFTPDWNAMLTHKKNGETFFEVPIKFAKGSTMATIASSSATKFDAHTDIEIPANLIITKHDNGFFSANIMLVQSMSPYLDGKIPKFNLFKTIEGFSGREFLYNLDGSFSKGWEHRNGKIVNTFILGRYSKRPHLETRDCTHYFLTYGGEIVAYLGSTCDAEGDGGGTTSSGWGSGGGGGGDNGSNDNDPPSDCTGSTGLKTFGFGSVSFFTLDLDGDGEVDGECASMSYDCRITVSNCPLQMWSPAELTYKTHEKWLYPGTFNSSGHSMMPGRTESINVIYPRAGFKCIIHCSANASFTLWAGPFGGIPKNANLADDAHFYIL
jgi:hypothetical protein